MLGFLDESARGGLSGNTQGGRGSSEFGHHNLSFLKISRCLIESFPGSL